MAAKAAAGGLTRRAPPGYVNVPRTKTRKAFVTLDPGKGAAVRETFESYARGYLTYGDVAEMLFEAGIRSAKGRPLSLEGVRRLLSNRFYVGAVRFGGQEFRGAHEPLLSEELFRRVQEVKAARSKDPGEKGSKFFLLRGIIYCGQCGRRWTAEDHPAKGRSYYRCTPLPTRSLCAERYVEAGHLDAKVEALLAGIRLDPAHVARLSEALDRVAAEHAGVRDAEVARLAKEMEDLRGRRLRLVDQFASGVFAEADVREVVAGYDRELAVLSARQAELGEDLLPKAELLKELLRKAAGLAQAYRRVRGPAERKEFLAGVFARIVVKDRTIERIEYRPPFSMFLEERGNGSNGLEETLKLPMAALPSL